MFIAVKQKNKKHMHAGLLGFVLSLIMFGILLILGICIGAFGESYILEKIKTSQYCEQSYKDFKQKAEDYCKDVGDFYSLVEKTYAEKRFRIHQRNFVSKNLNGKMQPQSYQNLQNELNEELESYLKEKKIPLTDEVKNGISEVTARIGNFYIEGIEIKIIEEIGKYRSEFIDIIKFIIPILIIISGFIILIILHIFPSKYKSLQYVSCSMFSAISMLIIASMFVFKQIDYGLVVIQSNYYREFIEQYTQGSVIAFLYSAGIGVIFLILLQIIIILMKKHEERQRY